jgi:uncharacterized protein
VFLLDVNALVALFWPAHESHGLMLDWFSENAKRGWATCPLTQAGFVRITANPSFSSYAVSPKQARNLLDENLNHTAHQFWPAQISYSDAVEPFGDNVYGYRQVTGAYLLGLAIHHGGKLATLDRGIRSFLATRSPHSSAIELIHRK